MKRSIRVSMLALVVLGLLALAGSALAARMKDFLDD